MPAAQHDPANVTGERIPLTKSEIPSADDWHGLADAKERRKRQNRLNQRRHRKLLLLYELFNILTFIRIQAKRPDGEDLRMHSQTVAISCLHPSQLANYIK